MIRRQRDRARRDPRKAFPATEPRTRRRRTRHARPVLRLLLLAGVLLPVLLAGLVIARPAPAAAATAAPGTSTAHAQLTSLAVLASPAQPAAASGVCSVPGIGDLGGLVGLCPSGSGLVGTIFGHCKNPPTPQPPGEGFSGWLEIRPRPLPAPAAAFGAHAPSTEYQQYGYAGLFWAPYDQPCLIPNFSAQLDTGIGDMIFSVAKGIVAVDNTVHTWASDPSWTSALTPLVSGATGDLYKALFMTWAGVALLTVALSVALRAHRADMPSALTLIGWAVLVIGLVSAVVAAPGWAGQQASALMGTTLDALDAGFVGPGGQANAAVAHDSLTVSSVLWPAWMRGEFGDPSSAVAQQYGPQLFEAQALSWAQSSGTPQQVAAAVKAEQAQWGKVAAKVQAASPQAYSAIQGNSQSRIGAGFLALLTAVIVCGFDLIASLVVIVALLGVLAGVIMLPALGVVGMHHNMRHLVTGAGSRILGMLINGVLWGAAAGVDQIATKMLLTQNVLPPVLAMLLLAILPVALWMVIRSLRGRPAVPRVVKRAAMLGLGYAFMRRGARHGVEDALDRAGPAGPTDMWWTDPWSWSAGPVPPGTLPPAPPAVPPVGGGPGPAGPAVPPPPPSGGGPLPRPPGGGHRPALPPAGPPPGPSSSPPPPRPGPGSPPQGPNGSGPPPSAPPSGPGSTGPALRPGTTPAGTGPAPAAPPAPPPPSSGPREYTGTPRQPGAEPDVLTPTRVFGPGEPPDPAVTYNGGSLYDGSPGTQPGVPPPWQRYQEEHAVWEQAARTPPPPPPAGGIPRQPAGTWQQAGEHPSERPEPEDGRARVWIENHDDGVRVVVERALGITLAEAADEQQAEIAARHAAQWPWGERR
jgi:hypothetical protein